MGTPLWTLGDLRDAVGGTTQADDRNILGVSIDSRTVQPGEAFIALKGPQFDGHSYIPQALKAGAAACVVSEASLVQSLPADAPLILVPDTKRALQDLGRAARARFSGTLIAITGSVGKTTTRSLCAAAFGSFARAHATQGNLNNHLGVPLTLARMPQDTEIAVIEMGMNHFGEIAALSRLARPHQALITALDWVHSENLGGTLAGVARAKAEIIEGLDGPVFAPQHIQDLLRPAIQAVRPTQEIRWIRAPYEGPLGLDGEVHGWNAALALAPVPKQHLAAAQAALTLVQPEGGRGTRHDLRLDGKRLSLIDQAYNASPASMKAAIASLVTAPARRKIALVGDMAELANPLKHHENLGKFLADQPLDMVVAVGTYHQAILDPLPPSILTVGLDSAQDAVPTLRPHLQDGDLVLVKASNSTGLTQVVREFHAVAGTT